MNEPFCDLSNRYQGERFRKRIERVANETILCPHCGVCCRGHETKREIAEKLIPISTKIGEAMKIYGFRFFLNSKTLLKTLALMKGKTVVTEEELDHHPARFFVL